MNGEIIIIAEDKSMHAPKFSSISNEDIVFRIVGGTRGQESSKGLHDFIIQRILIPMDTESNFKILIMWDGDNADKEGSFITVFLTTMYQIIPKMYFERLRFLYFVSSTSPFSKNEAPKITSAILPMMQMATLESVVAVKDSTDYYTKRLMDTIQDLKEEVNINDSRLASLIRQEPSFGLIEGNALIENLHGQFENKSYGSVGYCLLALAAARLFKSRTFTTVAIVSSKTTRITSIECQLCSGDCEWVSF